MEFNAYDIDIETFEFQNDDILIDMDNTPWHVFGGQIRSTWSVQSMVAKEDKENIVDGWLPIEYFRTRCVGYGPWKIIYRKS